MNRKRIFTIIFIGIISIAVAVPASWAGSRARHRLEGAVIGIGALMLTQAIIDHHHHDAAVATTVTHGYGHHRPHHKPAGYWDIQKEWVPATYKKVWNPGHYNRRGNWVPGRWIRIEVKPGHWTRKRVWRPYY